ncbi:MAG: RNA-binding cell elongation regulator Jag/EloR [Candidatus Margulisiibacteriota bacterium]
MKKIRMKGRSVDDAVKTALEVLGGEKDKARISIISEGKAGMLGVIGCEEAEVEVVLLGEPGEDAKQILQDILDKMVFMTVVELGKSGDAIELLIKGEDMGRIIGKEGTTLKSLEIILGSILGRMYGERKRVSIDADGYKKKREEALERLAKEVIDEVAQSGKERVLPPMSAADRRIIHLFIQENPKVTSFSKGEGRERRLVIAPRD